MKLTISTKVFHAAAQKAATFAAGGSEIPILQTILLSASNNTLWLTAGNGRKSVVLKATCQVDEPLGICLSAKRLAGILGEADGDRAEITVTGARASIASGRDNWTLAGEPAKEYPEFPEFGETVTWTADGKEFSSAIAQVFNARSTDGGSPNLASVYMSVNGEGLAEFVATSRRVLAKSECRVDGPTGNVLIPEEFAKDLRGIEGPANVVLSGSLIRVELPGCVLYSRLLEEAYPRWKQVIPTDNIGASTFGKAGFISAVRKVAQIGENEHNIKKIRLQFTEKEIFVSMTHAHSSKSSVPCGTQGEAMEAFFNADYLLQLLSGCPVDDVLCSWDNRGALTITAGTWMGIAMAIADQTK